MTAPPTTRLGPVAPARTGTSVLLPLGLDEVVLRGGFWGDRQRRNRTATLPHVTRQLEEAGNLANLRAVAAGDTTARHRNMVFADSDVYKWLEGVAWEQGREPAPELQRALRTTTDLLRAAQDDDGYLDTAFQLGEPGRRWTDLRSGHELYCLGHLTQAAIADVRATGADGLLEVACRFADRAVDLFGPGRREGLPGHPEVETALVELYRTTGEQRYLELATLFLDRRGRGLLGSGRFGSAYYQDDRPVREHRAMVGHAVRALYLATGMVDAYAETGDTSLLDAVVAQWDATLATKTYVTGGQGSRHLDEAFGEPYELPPDRAYAETCAGIASVMLTWRLLLATGEARYADDMERALYNVVAASTADDGRHFCYVNPLQRRGPGPARPDWYECACCPPNLLRLLASMQAYLVTRDAGGVQLHHYAAGTVDTHLADGRRVAFAVDTDYPASGRTTIRITGTDESPWSLALRIPAWADGATLRVAGATRPAVPDRRGYAVLTRTWRLGDMVTLDIDLPPRVLWPHPRIDAVRGTVALARGPVVYCLEQVDQPDADLADIAVAADLRPAPGRRGGLDTLEFDATVRVPATVGGAPYRSGHPESEERPVRLVAVPYHAWGNREAGAMRIWLPLRA
ncbi:beta-L-arabinofuranosidase domain-containing protein [Actinoplanes sp. NPDC051411]|uniref:glycoside hydrolase family 127 protein n=1 Tax=Actinoplanes sp. NPDC051411 TaxID=3155522 RepID=UPI00342A10EB